MNDCHDRRDRRGRRDSHDRHGHRHDPSHHPFDLGVDFSKSFLFGNIRERNHHEYDRIRQVPKLITRIQ